VTRSLSVALAVVYDLSPAATGSLPRAQDPPMSANSRHEIRLGGAEPILSMGKRSGDCEARDVRPLAPSGIPSLLALEVSSRWSSSATQEPACPDRYHGSGESELGRGTNWERIVSQTGSVRRFAHRRKVPEGGWASAATVRSTATLIHNHASAVVTCDFFTSVTATFQVLYVFVAI
jgi:hypothetical protein